jgi:hypothetical protein
MVSGVFPENIVHSTHHTRQVNAEEEMEMYGQQAESFAGSK